MKIMLTTKQRNKKHTSKKTKKTPKTTTKYIYGTYISTVYALLMSR